MAGTSIRHLAFLVAASVALSACENIPNPFAGKDNPAEDAASDTSTKSVRLVNRDVEAPETFQTTDTALWDGRPSLGGVWVASPDAVNPERVILRNEANGKFVIGALFRRERDNPGPKLQISSDAADALGMLAGQPGQLNVTALRRDDSEAEAAPAVAVTEEGDVETASVAPIVAASAALDKVDGAAATTDDAASGVSAPVVQDDLDPTPQPGETKRAARKRARAAAKAAAAAAEAPPPVDGDGALAAPVPALEVQTLPEAGEALGTPVASETPGPAPTTGTARIQIGIFSVEANAQRAADTLKAGGISADVRKEESNGKVFWSVVASGDGGSKALLGKVKGLGFNDAYVVSG